MKVDPFLHTLQEKAKTVARIEQSSPLPEWIRPFGAQIGLHYWQFLLCVSFIAAVVVSLVLFPSVYASVTLGH